MRIRLRRRRAAARAFTLIELATAVVIVGILVVLLLPALGKNREHARQVRCGNNLRSLYAAVSEYAVEHDGKLPLANSTEDYDKDRRPKTWAQNGTGWVEWRDYKAHNDNYNRPRPGYTYWWGPKGVESIKLGTLWDYAGGNMKMYACPTFMRPEFRGGKDPQGGDFGGENQVVRSYAMNSQLSGKDPGENDGSRTLLFADMAHTNRVGKSQIAVRSMREGRGSSQFKENAWNGSLDGYTNGAAWPVESVGVHHNGRGQAVFLDGHVEKVDYSSTTNVCSVDW